MTGFYHVCFVVNDIEKAMRDFTILGDISWNSVLDRTLGEWDYCITFSREEPYLELIQGPPGSPWHTTESGRFHHLGWWTKSLESTSRKLVDNGLEREFDGCPFGRPFAYHYVESIGARFEIMDAAQQTGFLSTWNPNGAAMPTVSD